MEDNGIRQRTREERITLRQARALLFIDENDVFDACRTQAEVYEQVGREAVYAVSERDQAKEYLKELKAKLIKRVHSLSTEKLTVQQADALVEQDEEYLEAVKDSLNKKLVADQWQNLQSSFEQRNSMLKKLAEIMLSGIRGEIQVKSMNRTGTMVSAAQGREDISNQRRDYVRKRS